MNKGKLGVVYGIVIILLVGLSLTFVLSAPTSSGGGLIDPAGLKVKGTIDQTIYADASGWNYSHGPIKLQFSFSYSSKILPLMNIVLGAILSAFSFISSGTLSQIFIIISGSSLMVAVFSSLPVPPLPGYSILKWNFYIYIIELAFSVTFLVYLGHGFI